MSRSMLDGPGAAAEAGERPRKRAKSGKGKQVASLRGDVVPLAKYLASNGEHLSDDSRQCRAELWMQTRRHGTVLSMR